MSDRAARGRTIAVAVAWFVLLLSGAATFVDLDCWHLMALARETIAAGRVPFEDHFAYTPTIFPVVNHEWGSGVVLYGLATHGGLLAFQLARLVLAATTTFLCVRVALLRGATTATLTVLAPTAVFMSWIGLTAIRPQVFTVVFLALWLTCIEADRHGRRWWMVPAVAGNIVWQNLHGGFVVGWGFLVIHAIEQAWRRQPYVHVLAVAVAMLALVVVNPYGWAYYPYLAHALTMSRELIGEWGPIWRASSLGFALYVVSLAIAVGALAGNRRCDVPGWPILAVAAYLAARHERHVSIYALVWFAFVPGLLAATRVGETLYAMWHRPSSPIANTLVATALALSIVSFVSHRPWRLSVPGAVDSGAPATYPVGAVAYLATHHVEGNVLTPFVVGAFVSWKLGPAIKISLDSRYEAAYPPHQLEEHLDFYRAAPGWPAMLDRYPTNFILAPRTSEVTPLLATQSPWKPVYEDDAYVLFARTNSPLPYESQRGRQLIGSLP